MENPLVTKELLDAIRELRGKLEEKLRQNKYYAALTKVDDLLVTVKSLVDSEREANLSGRLRPNDEAKNVLVAEGTTADTVRPAQH
jgi:hypothetical protein